MRGRRRETGQKLTQSTVAGNYTDTLGDCITCHCGRFMLLTLRFRFNEIGVGRVAVHASFPTRACSVALRDDMDGTNKTRRAAEAHRRGRRRRGAFYGGYKFRSREALAFQS